MKIRARVCIRGLSDRIRIPQPQLEFLHMITSHPTAADPHPRDGCMHPKSAHLWEGLANPTLGEPMVAHSAQPFPLYCRDFLYGAAISSTVSRLSLIHI